MAAAAAAGPGGFQFAIDRGGTFTDVFARCPGGRVRVLKLLSEDPGYGDAPTEGIRRVLQEVPPPDPPGTPPRHTPRDSPDPAGTPPQPVWDPRDPPVGSPQDPPLESIPPGPPRDPPRDPPGPPGTIPLRHSPGTP